VGGSSTAMTASSKVPWASGRSTPPGRTTPRRGSSSATARGRLSRGRATAPSC
jgi:hypothetical protein